ncbi:MAG TPA: sigma-70 family RNA polymerase sigma factor [Polyangiales bacterium]|jgi:RNA polymerase sigma factor (sigma-70 family)
MTDVERSALRLLRDLAPQVLGVVVRRFADFAASEDAVQEALIAAAAQWPRDGIPENPRAWLIHVAGRRMTDHARAEIARRQREAIVVSLIPVDEQLALAADEQTIEHDDTLDLLFMCCHPTLSPSSAIALTLRAVGGLTTSEIASAFMVPEPTMGQRISRAKQTIKDSGIPFELPAAEERATRLGAVLHVLYLIFSEGYTASTGAALQRHDLATEALRLTRVLRQLVPDDGEVAALLALMLLTDARRAARSGPEGELIPLDEQDRTRWDRAAIDEGVALISETLARGTFGPYALQAAIAAVHDEATSAEQTDWAEIAELYDLWRRISDNPMVVLNHAIAWAMLHGPQAGLERLDRLTRDPRLENHHRLHAVRAHLLERAGEREAAIESYRRAAERTTSVPERDYLLTRAGKLSG